MKLSLSPATRPLWAATSIFGLLLVASRPCLVHSSFAFSGRSSSLVSKATTRSSSSVVLPAVWQRENSNNNNDNNNNDDDAAYWDAVARNKARTDVRNFLTQRALQSFIFLLLSCRDEPTVKWMESHFDFRNLEHYHGTGALNLTKWDQWDSFLLDLLQRPQDAVIVTARPRGQQGGQGRYGWSKNNPHKPVVSYVEYVIDINPPSLVARIVSVREQIAKEWVSADLDTLIAANDMILQSYHEFHVAAREREEESLRVLQDKNNSTTTDSSKNAAAAAAAFGNDDCINVENLETPPSLLFDDNDRSRRGGVFDRNAMLLLSNAISFDERSSSPYRQSNFDLLCLLATQEAVHRVLRQYRDNYNNNNSQSSLLWLREFYARRVSTVFDGHQQRYGRAEDFLEELLSAPPVMKQVVDAHDRRRSSQKEMMGSLIMIDPLRIAEDVIRMRSVVAKEWKDVVANVPLDHMSLRREILNKQMEKSASSSTLSSLTSAAAAAVTEKRSTSSFDLEEGFQ